MLNFDLKFWKEVKINWISDKNNSNHINQEQKDKIRDNVQIRIAKRERKISAIDFINGDDEL